MSNFEVLDARIASTLNKIIHNSPFKRRVSLEVLHTFSMDNKSWEANLARLRRTDHIVLQQKVGFAFSHGLFAVLVAHRSRDALVVQCLRRDNEEICTLWCGPCLCRLSLLDLLQASSKATNASNLVTFACETGSRAASSSPLLAVALQPALSPFCGCCFHILIWRGVALFSSSIGLCTMHSVEFLFKLCEHSHKKYGPDRA